MIPKFASLKKKNDIERVFKSGRTIYNKLLGIKILENQEKANRLAIIISSKVSKKAVERNKARRRLKEIVKKELKSATKNYDLVLIVLPAVIDKDFAELNQAVSLSLRRLRII